MCLLLATNTGRGYKCFDFLDAKVVSVDSLEARRPGVSAAIERQLEGRISDPVPVAFLICDANGPIDLSTITYGYDITLPFLDLSFEDAKACLREHIANRIRA